MDNVSGIFGKLGFPSQGSVLEKIDKLIRVEERKELNEMLKKVQEKGRRPN